LTPNDDRQSDAAKRTRILEAAFEVCRRRGAVAARMEEVAALAQVSKGTLYRFFKSKEDLLLATIIANYEEDLRVMSARAPGARDADAPVASDARVALDQLFEGLTELFEEIAPTMVVFYQSWAVVADNEESRKRLDEFMKAFHADRHRENAQLIRRGQQAGVFRADVSAEVMAQSIDALLDGYLYWATFDPESATPGAFRAGLDALARSLLSVEAPPTAAETDGT
jgi:AcrR family transcriptional regulator